MSTSKRTARSFIVKPADSDARVSRFQAARLAVSVRALTALGEGQKPKRAGEAEDWR